MLDIEGRLVEFRLAQCIRDVEDRNTREQLFRQDRMYVVEYVGKIGETMNELCEHHIIYQAIPFTDIKAKAHGFSRR